MDKNNLTYLLEFPDQISEKNTEQIDEIIKEYPYFQSARAVQLKGLNITSSFKYNKALKKTASYTTDRKVLFDFITAPFFINQFDSSLDFLNEIEVIDAETIEILHQKISDHHSSDAPEGKIEQEANELLKIGSPIQFKSNEPHSFNEWMQLISHKPILRGDSTKKENNEKQVTTDKTGLIEKFLKSNPKIKPIDKNSKNNDISFNSSLENNSLMTETLAKVYLEQKKYENAIKAYRILSLKYPEKSGFFADRIKAVKILQRNKS